MSLALFNRFGILSQNKSLPDIIEINQAQLAAEHPTASYFIYDWRINGTSYAKYNINPLGSSAQDFSTTGINLLNEGGTPTYSNAGHPDGKYYLDHPDAQPGLEFITPSNTFILGTTEFTLSVSAKSDVNHNGRFVGGDNTGGITPRWSHGVISEQPMGDITTINTVVGAGLTDTTGFWRHYIFVYTTNEVKLYYKGVLVDTSDSWATIGSVGAVVNPTIHISGRTSNTDLDFIGDIGAVVFYNGAMSPEQIALMGDGSPEYGKIAIQERTNGEVWNCKITAVNSAGAVVGTSVSANHIEGVSTNAVLSIPTVSVADVSGNLVATFSGGDFDTADNFIYDWQKSTDGGNTWNSINILNLTFDESANHFNDYSTHEHSFSNTGTTSTASGKIGYGMDVSVGKYISTPDNADLKSATFSLSLWLKTTVGGNTVFYDKDGNAGFNMQLVNGALNFVTGGGVRARSGTVIVNDGIWHSIIVTKASGQNPTIFVDGVDVTTNALSTDASFSTGALTIGGRANLYTTVGTYDNVQLFDHVLSAEQISYIASEEYDKLASQELSTGHFRVQVTSITLGVAGSKATSNTITI